MTRTLLACCTLALLAACQSPARQQAAPPVIASGGEAPNPSQVNRPALTTEVLPAFVPTGTVKADTALLERPKPSSAILQTLPAGKSVQLLGELNNAEGQWLSVSLGDIQGWVRASAVTQ